MNKIVKWGGVFFSPTVNMDIGRKIFSARRNLGKEYTQDWLALELEKQGIRTKRSWVANLEGGRIKKIDGKIVDALSKILKQPIEYFGDIEIRDAPSPKINFPIALEKKIIEESEKRLLNFETTVILLLSEYFTKKLGEHK